MDNRRKVYVEEESGREVGQIARPCRECGCRHRIVLRAHARGERVIVVSRCRMCGAETYSRA